MGESLHNERVLIRAVTGVANKPMKLLLATTIALLPTAVIAQQFTPEQIISVMVSSSENLDVRVDDPLLLSLNDKMDIDDLNDDEEDGDDDDRLKIKLPKIDDEPKGPKPKKLKILNAEQSTAPASAEAF